MMPRIAASLVVATAWLALVAVLSAAPPATSKENSTVGAGQVLTMASYWRWQVAYRRPLMRRGQDLKEITQGKESIGFDSALPPADWAAPDFDDQAWPRMQGPFFKTVHGHAYVPAVEGKGYTAYEQGNGSSALLCIRGKFTVTDPKSAGDMTLSLSYRGGIVVYINGKEAARGNLPDADKKGLEALAEDYSNDVCLDADGKLIGIGPSAEKNADRLEKRIRRLTDINIPAANLRQGINVLAVEVHRAPYPDAILKYLGNHGEQYFDWVPMGLVSLELTAAGAGVVPNVSRPKGLQVWAQDIHERVIGGDYSDPNESPGVVRLFGARNGSFCGQAAVGSTGALKSIRAEVSDLKVANGPATIAAANVAVLYGVPMEGNQGQKRWFDGLTTSAPDEIPADSGGADLPIVIRVRVPKDAAAGDYSGRLTVSSAGENPMVVPIKLNVTEWAVPDPKYYRTFVALYQSPATLAMHYKVKEWSEEHWKLEEQSLALIGRAGNKLLNVTIAEHTQFGNDEGMIYWVKRPDGGYDYDFTVFDRFVAMAKKHCGTLDYVALHVWHSGGWETRKADQENTVTVVDPATGKRESMQVPTFGTEESKKFYKPLLEACREHLAKVGLDRAMCLGILSDGTAPNEVFSAFDEIWPGGGPSKWTRGLHSPDFHKAPYDLIKGGAQVVLHEYVYVPGLADPDKPLPPIWNLRAMPGALFDRSSGGDVLRLTFWKNLPEESLFRNTKGVGRFCLDFWPVIKTRGGPWYTTTLYNRFPYSSCAQRAPSLMSMTWPGPAGAEPTIRYELLCQGVQNAEADIVVADALANHADELGKDLADRCQQTIANRLRYLRGCAQAGYGISARCDHFGWEDLDQRVYQCAAEVTRKLAERK